MVNYSSTPLVFRSIANWGCLLRQFYGISLSCSFVFCFCGAKGLVKWNTIDEVTQESSHGRHIVFKLKIVYLNELHLRHSAGCDCFSSFRTCPCLSIWMKGRLRDAKSRVKWKMIDNVHARGLSMRPRCFKLKIVYLNGPHLQDSAKRDCFFSISKLNEHGLSIWTMCPF